MAKVAGGVAGRSILFGRGASRLLVRDSDKISESIRGCQYGNRASLDPPKQPRSESPRWQTTSPLTEHSYAVFANIPADRSSTTSLKSLRAKYRVGFAIPRKPKHLAKAIITARNKRSFRSGERREIKLASFERKKRAENICD